MALFLGAVADDDTGATDLGNMLSLEGMRVAVVTQGEASAFEAAVQACDAVVIGTASRSIANDECYRRTREAVRQLRSAGAQRVLVKYCSTFDSTPEGNIGASIDAAMDELGSAFTLALPAQPSLGRTTYMGYHFVHEQLLSDSPMRHHPLTPMTNPHLPAHLATQTQRQIGLLTYPNVANGAASAQTGLQSLEGKGAQIVIADCVDETQLQTLGDAAADMLLVTGSSAWGTALPRAWARTAVWKPIPDVPLARAAGGSGILCVSGSCSVATARQMDWARRNGWTVFDPSAARRRDDVPALPIFDIAAALGRGENVLVTTGQAHREAADSSSAFSGATAKALGEQIGSWLAAHVAAIFQRQQPKGLIIAGGETSSTLVRALQLGGMRIGKSVEHGVPLCTAINVPSLALVLKSGNFGSENFFGLAAAAIQEMSVEKGEA